MYALLVHNHKALGSLIKISSKDDNEESLLNIPDRILLQLMSSEEFSVNALIYHFSEPDEPVSLARICAKIISRWISLKWYDV